MTQDQPTPLLDSTDERAAIQAALDQMEAESLAALEAQRQQYETLLAESGQGSAEVQALRAQVSTLQTELSASKASENKIRADYAWLKGRNDQIWPVHNLAAVTFGMDFPRKDGKGDMYSKADMEASPGYKKIVGDAKLRAEAVAEIGKLRDALTVLEGKLK